MIRIGREAPARGAIRPNRRAGRRRFRPFLDALEGRALLSTVTSLLDNGDPGTLRYEIAHANPGDTIDFQAGLSGTITLTAGELVIDRSLSIAGPGQATVLISGNQISRVASVVGDVDVSIAGLTIMNGKANPGGGLYEGGEATLRVADCAFLANQAQGGPGEAGKGAGLYADEGATLTVTRCVFADNEAHGGGPGSNHAGGPGEGGGLFLVTTTTTEVRDSLFTNNRAIGGTGVFGGHSGGAAINNHGDLDVINTQISGNVSIGGNGVLGGFATSGGIINENSPFTTVGETGASLNLINSQVNGNLAVGGTGWLIAGSAFGAGVTNLNADLVVQNSTMTDNSAVVGSGLFGFSLGGALLSFGGTVSLQNSTIARNRASVHLFDDTFILSQIV